MMKLTVGLLMCVMSALFVATYCLTFDVNGCVADGNDLALKDFPDLFEHKATPHYTTTWTVEYHNTYKVVHAGCANAAKCSHKLVLYQCGTPIPTVPLATRAIPIPIRRVAVGDMPIAEFIGLLGERRSIVAAPPREYTTSNCIHRLLDENLADSIITAGCMLNETTASRISADVTFSSTFGMSAPYPETLVPFWDRMERSTYGVLEYLLFTSLFFNKEQVATEHIRRVTERVDCQRQAIRTLKVAPVKVFWMSYAFPPWNWDVATTCPNYYCELTSMIGGTLLTNFKTNADGSLADTAIAAAKTADVWIFPDVWTDEIVGAMKYMDWPTQTPAWINKRIFAVDLNGGMNDWFENRLAHPDDVLSDLISAYYGAQDPHLNHPRLWLRNVFTEKSRPHAIQDVPGCPDLTAPRSTWFFGCPGDENTCLLPETLPANVELADQTICRGSRTEAECRPALRCATSGATPVVSCPANGAYFEISCGADGRGEPIVDQSRLSLNV